MKKVHFLIGTLKMGGTENSIVQLLNYLSVQEQIKLNAAVYGHGLDLISQTRQSVKVLEPQFDKGKDRWYAKILRLLKLRMILVKENPDCILSMGEVWNNFALVLSIGFNTRKIIADRGDYNYPWPKLHEFLREVLYPIAATIIIQRTFQRKNYERLVDPHKIKVLKNHFSEEKIKTIHQNNLNTQKGNTVLTVGRFIPSKRIDLAIRVFKNAGLMEKGYQLWVVGDDDLGFNIKDELFQLAESLNIKEHVQFLGFRNDILTLMAASPIFIFTSESEGMPNVLIEALFAGCQVFTLYDYLDLKEMQMANYHVCDSVDQMAFEIGRIVDTRNHRVHPMSDLSSIFNVHAEYLNLITN